MRYVSEPLEKITDIRTTFEPLIGKALVGYECGEMYWDETDTWSRWDDLPIRLHFDNSEVVSVSWTEFDALHVSPRAEEPDWLHESTKIRWDDNLIPEIDKCIGQRLSGVALGRGEFSVEGRDIEVWTRLMLDLDGHWFEIFNALDENGYEYHAEAPSGDFRKCT